MSHLTPVAALFAAIGVVGFLIGAAWVVAASLRKKDYKKLLKALEPLKAKYGEQEVQNVVAQYEPQALADAFKASRRRMQRRVARSSAQGITGLAVLLAGRKRSSARDEWRSHLAGETGRGLPPEQRVRAALGFVVAAVRYRIQDAADAGWRVADAVLKSRKVSNGAVFVPTGIAAIVILHHDGAAETLASYESIAALGGTLYAVIRVGRWYRDVKPPEPKARIKE